MDPKIAGRFITFFGRFFSACGLFAFFSTLPTLIDNAHVNYSREQLIVALVFSIGYAVLRDFIDRQISKSSSDDDDAGLFK